MLYGSKHFIPYVIYTTFKIYTILLRKFLTRREQLKNHVAYLVIINNLSSNLKLTKSIKKINVNNTLTPTN